MKTITKEKLESYYALSKEALEIIKSSIIEGQEARAKEVIEMTECYLSDAKHFQKNNDFVNAFACINYAHGWIDCACRLKIFKINNNNNNNNMLFAVDAKEKTEEKE